MKRLIIYWLALICFMAILLPVSHCNATQMFSLSNMPTSPEAARDRTVALLNHSMIYMVPRPPAILVMVVPQFWHKKSMQDKAGIIRDMLYYVRFTHDYQDRSNYVFILFNKKNPLEEFGWGNVYPGDIIVFK